jgi:hypothetical protein
LPFNRKLHPQLSFEFAMSAPTETSRPASGTTRAGPDPAPAGQPPGDPPFAPHPTDAIREALTKLGELREFAAYYAATKFDAIKLTIRKLGILAGVGLIAGIGAATVVVVAVVLFIRGIAGALTELFPRYPWLGDLIAGVIFLAIPVVAVLIGMRILTRTFKTLTVQKYETRQRQQRQQFGRDVRDEAASARGSAGETH